MNNEFFEALSLLEKERGIPVDYMLEKISAAITIAVKKNYNGNDDIVIDMNTEKRKFVVYLRKTVVEEIENPNFEILLEDALKYSKKAMVGEKVNIKLNPKDFGRIAAQVAKHVIRQGIREAERGQAMQEWESKQQELVTAIIEKIDAKTGAVTLRVGKAEAVLPKSEQVGDEVFRENGRTKVYIVDVRDSEKGPKVMISRTHPGLVKRLFEMEVPEIHDGTVEIKAIAREAGSRTKIAVYAADENVDAVGSCIGPRGARVGKIVDELSGEKIDIVKYSDDPSEFISAALSPAEVIAVIVDPEGAKSCQVTVPDGQLSLAIGNKGQNARLAAKLTQWKIDIKPASGFYGE